MDVDAVVAGFLSDQPLPLWIDGAPRRAQDGLEIEIESPSVGKPIAIAACAGAGDVDDAVAAAVRAFPAWSATSPQHRAERLRAFATLMDEHLEVIAALETLDVGKPLRDARGFDVPFAINAYRYFADVVSQDRSVSLPVDGIEVTRHGAPRGVCALIHPWNAPFLLSSWSIAPALAAGNTVVLKPSELTPLSSLYVARLAVEAGIPAGVFNVVPGPGQTAGERLIHHPDVALISFTGSPETGRRIAVAAAESFTPTKLELGGKGAAVIFDDVDVRATARALGEAVTLNAGQVCCTATRWVVHERIFDELVADAAGYLTDLEIGPGNRDSSDMGPLITAQARDRVLSMLGDGMSSGADFLLEGGDIAPKGAEGGYYVKPALMTGPVDNVCAQREIFGPVAYVVPFKTPSEAVEIVNGSHYGLANSVWSADVQRAEAVAERLIAGSAWINAHNVFAYGLPYGGVNLSGWGGGVNGADTLRTYEHTLTIAKPV